jgi:hypothetical protein
VVLVQLLAYQVRLLHTQVVAAAEYMQQELVVQVVQVVVVQGVVQLLVQRVQPTQAVEEEEQNKDLGVVMVLQELLLFVMLIHTLLLHQLQAHLQ